MTGAGHVSCEPIICGLAWTFRVACEGEFGASATGPSRGSFTPIGSGFNDRSGDKSLATIYGDHRY